MISNEDLAATAAIDPCLAAVVEGIRERRDTPPTPPEPLPVYAARRWAEYEGHPNRAGQVAMQVAAHGRRLLEDAR